VTIKKAGGGYDSYFVLRGVWCGSVHIIIVCADTIANLRLIKMKNFTVLYE
jgi:hypothetical protein